MSDRINISRQVREICDALGIDPDCTNLITLDIQPATATARLFVRDDNGKLLMDLALNEPKVEILEFKVRT